MNTDASMFKKHGSRAIAFCAVLGTLVATSVHGAVVYVDHGSHLDGSIDASAGGKTIQINAGATADLLIVGTSTEFGSGTIGGWSATYDGNVMTNVTGNGANSMIFCLDLTETTYSGGTANLAMSWDYTAGGDLGVGWVSVREDSGGAIVLHSTASSGGSTSIDLVTSTNGTFNFVNFNGNKGSGTGPESPLTEIYHSASFGSNAGAAGYQANVAAGTNTYSWVHSAPRRNDAVAFEAVPVPDTEPPTILSLDPADDALSAPVSGALVATFSESVALTGEGTITITDLTNGDSSETITLPAPSQVTVAGTDLTIVPSAALQLATHYSVQISADAIEDMAPTPNPFAGILNDTTWDFTTTAAALLADYEFTDSDLTSSDASTSWTTTDLSSGGGIPVGYDGSLGQPAPSLTLVMGNINDGTLLDNDYYSFTIAPADGYEINFIQFSFDIYKVSGGADVDGWLFSDVDGFTAGNEIGSGTISATTSWETKTISLSGLPTVTTAVEFRLYLDTGGTFASNQIKLDNLQVTGAANPLPPSGTVIWVR